MLKIIKNFERKEGVEGFAVKTSDDIESAYKMAYSALRENVDLTLNLFNVVSWNRVGSVFDGMNDVVVSNA
jgi:hypothetical protein